MALDVRPLEDIVLPGLVAGVLSTLALGACARLVGKRAAAPVSAVSHWVWPQEVNQTARPRPRHLVTGLAIHHLMSVGWAAVNAYTLAAIEESVEPCRASRAAHGRRFALASALTAVAAFSDYVIVPKRFTPGFEFHLRVPHIAAVYVAFGAGLVAPFVVEDLCGPRRR
ncbi:hypothetical protein [Paraburkholderia phenoliruptrix]|uniref:Uncharacterized protein n=1 Tax=Burkholderia sp. (strain CCGE1003) TaxID=640512 RepID=E1T734_BURSG|nr:hypothetical protein [Paraburkholderia phenoliruptrix]MBW9104600.1 hypothetical protein [Paraburkholderia phenoliruptrix]MBW9129077.1 hypothetical protein [Paraburkholderia ginsengiterrae]